ncbi:MAG: hypothetical protein CL663_04680 [Bacteroidetes bacterium]|nr:hypothetical protein [Bacteroidota bacterium]
MMKRIIVWLLLVCPIVSFAVNDTVWINEVEVSAKRTTSVYAENARVITVITQEEIQQAPIQSLTDLLEYAVNVDIRQRGAHGVQTDISIRGGSFDQTLILINGIPFNDPQTGHHNGDLPFDVDHIKQIEILKGPASRVFGPNAFSGAINIITGSDKKNNARLRVSGGEHDLYHLGLGANIENETISNNLSISKSGSDGYIENTDYQIINAHYFGTYKLDNGSVSLQAAYQDKSFGANSFYTPKYPNQYEQTKTRFISANWQGGTDLRYNFSTYYKEHNDRFELFRTNPASWYSIHNYHLTKVWGLQANIEFNSEFGKSAVGASFRNEKVLSNVLGLALDQQVLVGGTTDIYYTKSDSRDNVSFFFEHAYYTKNFSITGGIMANYHSVYDWQLFPGVDLSYRFTDEFSMIASVNKSFRIPTFTDLYYVGPTNIGNPDILPEEAISYEAGFKYGDSDFIAEAVYFYRDGKNIIDWVRLTEEVKWESKNITELNTQGLEFNFMLSPRFFAKKDIPINRIRLSYALIDVTKSSADYISRYALDYLKHKISFNLSHKIYKDLNFNWYMTYQDRAGSYLNFASGLEENYEPFVLLDARLSWEIENWNVYLEASNLFDASYFDISNVVMPGRWIKAGFTFDLPIR